MRASDISAGRVAMSAVIFPSCGFQSLSNQPSSANMQNSHEYFSVAISMSSSALGHFAFPFPFPLPFPLLLEGFFLRIRPRDLSFSFSPLHTSMAAGDLSPRADP